MVFFSRCLKSIVKLIMIVSVLITLLNYSNVFQMKVRKFKIVRISNVNMTLREFKESPAKIKYLLIWTNDAKWEELKQGKNAFKENNCKYDNCYVTKDRKLVGGDYRNFDAILINGITITKEEYNVEANTTLPTKRNRKQLYIFTMRESAVDYPVCDKRFDNYFNLTWAYKLDSDILWPYFTISDIENKAIGPARNINWKMKSNKLNKDKILKNKKYAAIWVADNYTNNKGEATALGIKRALADYKLKVDIYKDYFRNAHKFKVQSYKIDEYYFYFAFENYIAEDYVTDVVVKALSHDSVPVVFGGAQYIRFLPPNSYIDARYQPTRIVASKMAYLIKNQTAYLNYFRWQNHYRYTTKTSSICDLCESLNKKVDNQIVRRFRKWWNPRYKSVCKKKLFEELKTISDSLLVESKSDSDGGAIKDLLMDNVMNRPEDRKEKAKNAVYKF